jgi:hypothetical protein
MASLQIRKGREFLKYWGSISSEEQREVLLLVKDAVRFLCFGSGGAFEVIPAGVLIELRRGNQSVWLREVSGGLELANARLDRAELDEEAADQARGILIDSRGTRWPDNSPTLAQRYGYGPPDEEFVYYTIRERGCIHLARQADSVRITLHAGKFTQCTLLGALLALETCPLRILVSLYDSDTWSHQMIMSMGTFAEHAEELAADRPYGTREPCLAKELDAEMLGHPRLTPLKSLFNLWQYSRGRLPDDFASTVASLGLGHRAILLRRLPASDRLVHEIVPMDVPYMRPSQWLDLLGRDVEELPDRRYAAWAKRHYLEVLTNGQPRVDAIRATIRTIDGATLHSRYYRLAVPWRRADDIFVSVLSVRRELSTSPRRTKSA